MEGFQRKFLSHCLRTEYVGLAREWDKEFAGFKREMRETRGRQGSGLHEVLELLRPGWEGEGVEGAGRKTTDKAALAVMKMKCVSFPPVPAAPD